MVILVFLRFLIIDLLNTGVRCRGFAVILHITQTLSGSNLLQTLGLRGICFDTNGTRVTIHFIKNRYKCSTNVSNFHTKIGSDYVCSQFRWFVTQILVWCTVAVVKRCYNRIGFLPISLFQLLLFKFKR